MSLELGKIMDTSNLSFLTILLVVEQIILIQAELTAVNDSYHAGYLYMQRRNADLSIMPHDRHGGSASDICNNIMKSGYFDDRGIDPIDMNFDENTPERFVQARQEALRVQIPSTPAAALFERPYVRGRVTFEGFSEEKLYIANKPITEYVIVCLGKKRHSGDLVIYYVSKEYNLADDVSLLGFLLGLRPYVAARFIFKPILEGLPLVALAEEPAKAFSSPDFNVELQYIHTRERNTSVQDQAQDPLCKLASRESVALNQHERLCIAILSSPYFEGRERYTRKPRFDEGCVRRRVEFQSEEATSHVSGIYYEWMLECRATVTGNVYYISRAYLRNFLFVYTGREDSPLTYLENYSSDVRIADGLPINVLLPWDDDQNR